MKRLLKPLLLGISSAVLTFALSGWAAFSLLLRYHGFEQVPTDPDYHAAIAMGSWGCFIQATMCGTVVGLATGALVTWYVYRRNKNSALPSLQS